MNKLYIVLILTILLNSCSMQGDKFKIIGHRGAMGYETENTLASIQKAMDLGVDMIEIDVFQIKSGETVVFHDERLERLSNAGGNIEEYDYADLKKVILDGNHKIPTLQEVLKLIDNKVALNIELKGSNTATRVNFILDYYVNKKGWAWDNIVISSFNWDELREMRKLNPDVAIAVLTEDDDPTKAIPVAKELNAISINPWFKTLTAENTKQIHNQGFKILTYTVNKPEEISKMRDLGVDGIFTNFPDRVN